MSNFKVGDKVRFKGKTEWHDVTAASCLADEVNYIKTNRLDCWFPESSFTKRRPKSSGGRLKFWASVLPETLSQIRLESKQSGLSHGKVIDSKFTEGGGK